MSATRRQAIARRSRSITESSLFSTAAMSAILANAGLLGMETYAGLTERWHTQLRLAELVFLAVFTAEITLRALSHLDCPKQFFREPWNIFDAAVILCAFLPGLGDNTTLLRMLRLLRILRAARFMPQMRIIMTALVKSAGGAASFLAVGLLVLYVYAMVGWMWFADDDPTHYGSIGRAALTLFILMTLDGLGEAVRAGLEISPWSFAYYASYVLLSSFMLVNLLIGVVINSLEQARGAEADASSSRSDDARDGGAGAGPQEAHRYAKHPATEVDPVSVRERFTKARRALDDAERLALSTLPHQSTDPRRRN
ncbi:ion transporter [Streptomyces durmitorensis]